MLKVTKILAEWTYHLQFEDIPTHTVNKAKQQLLGILGAIFAGVKTDGARAALSAVKQWGDKPESTVICGDYKTSMRNAGLINSISAQVLEYEDWIWASHTGATVVPAALAVAEAVRASGKQYLTAQIIGNEIAGRTGEAIWDLSRNGNAIPNHQIEVPLIAGKLLQLSPEQLKDAIGNSCIQSQTTVFIGWSGQAKGLLTGMPVYTGITAANLSQSGFGGNHEIIEHPAGFCYNVSSHVELELIVKNLGKDWRTDTINIKPYPVCGFHSTAIDCVIDLVHENQIIPTDIVSVKVYCPTIMVLTGNLWHAVDDLFDKICTRKDWDYTPLLFDARYQIAATIVDKELTPRQYTADRIYDTAIHQLIPKIQLIPDIKLDFSILHHQRLGAKVIIVLKDGTEYVKEHKVMRGSKDKPIDASEKLVREATGLYNDNRIKQIIDTIDQLEELTDISQLTELLLVNTDSATK